MTISWLVKPGSVLILIFLFLTLQISACNSNGPVEPTGDNIISDDSDAAETVSDNIITDDPDTENTAVLTDVSLSWAAPSERENNEPISLSEIAGYKIYYGTIENHYPNSIDINDGKAEAYTFTGFSAGTYYFVLTTFDTQGRESQYSPAVKIVV